ncbi:unnamed protein product [Periconia digitata]|uniref:Uncharacterized protein n=1 Tax=Periconia digitata TaxID=1303443 RepID=A0A9W4U274_9PLEO|nr:unnamed protein product [Periconia digitata]
MPFFIMIWLHTYIHMYLPKTRGSSPHKTIIAIRVGRRRQTTITTTPSLGMVCCSFSLDGYRSARRPHFLGRFIVWSCSPTNCRLAHSFIPIVVDLPLHTIVNSLPKTAKEQQHPRNASIYILILILMYLSMYVCTRSTP